MIQPLYAPGNLLMTRKLSWKRLDLLWVSPLLSFRLRLTFLYLRLLRVLGTIIPLFGSDSVWFLEFGTIASVVELLSFLNTWTHSKVSLACSVSYFNFALQNSIRIGAKTVKNKLFTKPVYFNNVIKIIKRPLPTKRVYV